MIAKDTPLGEKPDWLSLKEEVCRKIDYVAAAWEKLDAPDEWKDKIRRDLLLPNLELLAEFCANVDVNDDEGSGNGPGPATAGSGERMTSAAVPGLAGGLGAAPNVLSSCFLHGEYTGSIFCPTCEREAGR